MKNKITSVFNSILDVFAKFRTVCHFLPLLSSVAWVIHTVFDPSRFVSDYIHDILYGGKTQRYTSGIDNAIQKLSNANYARLYDEAYAQEVNSSNLLVRDALIHLRFPITE